MLATPLRSVNDYADEDGNVSMKIRQRFRDTDEIRSRRRVIPVALEREEEDLRGVTLARDPTRARRQGGGGRRRRRRRRRPAAAAGGACAGLRGTCVLLSAAVPAYI